MRILICTYGRSSHQVTWNSLPESVRERTTLVVQNREKSKYPKYPTLVLPKDIKTIGDTRQFLIETMSPLKICMLDDDLVFAVRRQDYPAKLREPIPHELETAFGKIEYLLNTGYYVHVGMAPREGANRDIREFLYNTRMMRVLAYDTGKLMEMGVQFNRLPLMEDFDVTLQLLRKGYPNALLNFYTHNQGGSNSEGGCSTYRTPKLQEKAARGLAELHHPYVKVVKKSTKVAWGGGERYDVRIMWKAAYDSSVKR